MLFSDHILRVRFKNPIYSKVLKTLIIIQCLLDKDVYKLLFLIKLRFLTNLDNSPMKITSISSVSSLMLICLFSLIIIKPTMAQNDTIYFNINLKDAVENEFLVKMKLDLTGKTAPFIDVRMPAWSPGYYQMMDFAKNVRSFQAQNSDDQGTLRWVKLDSDTWRVYSNKAKNISLHYRVHTPRSFVGTAYLDSNRAFIKPAAVLMYVDQELERPSHLQISTYKDWDRVATGLDSVPGQSFAFVSPNFDTLYDSPLLVGKLQELPPFYINGIKHRFLGYAMGEFDGAALMQELKKIVQSSVDLMGGDIPYPHYTFIGIGPGQGGIEQSNSTAISFTGSGLEGAGRMRTLSFITHEYFHHYNIKRIRPIELGPFDYGLPNRTNLLWVAEGLTTYYENVILNRAGMMNPEEILRNWESHINGHESNQGKFHQSLAESSAQTWEDGPFGNPGESISYYVKGPIIGMLLDLEIRGSSENRYSLDDVMRHLYTTYYKDQGRGFSDQEVMAACEQFAGKDLSKLFNYIYTTDPIDYQYYFSKGGLNIELSKTVNDKGQKQVKSRIRFMDQPSALQKKIKEDMFRN